MRDVEAFLGSLKQWAEHQPDIEAVALVGSRARGTARPDSDVDLVMVVNRPEVYVNDDAWLQQFGPLRGIKDEDWGILRSRRAVYDDGSEVEFGLTTSAWLAIDPVDAGTERVIKDGVRPLLDRTGTLRRLIARVQSGGQERDR